MGLIPSLNVFVPGTPILASQVNNNFDTIVAVVNGGLSEENIQNLSISTALIANSAVTTVKIFDGAVTTVKLDDSSVTTEKLANTAVTEDKLASNSVTLTKIASNSVDTGKIVDNSVTVDKMVRLSHRVVSEAFTLQGGDIDSTIVVNASGSTTLTIPHDDTVNLPIGSVVEILPYGSGAVVISPASGVTLLSIGGQTGSRTSAEQYSSVFVRKLNGNEWVVQGLLL